MYKTLTLVLSGSLDEVARFVDELRRIDESFMVETGVGGLDKRGTAIVRWTPQRYVVSARLRDLRRQEINRS